MIIIKLIYRVILVLYDEIQVVLMHDKVAKILKIPSIRNCNDI